MGNRVTALRWRRVLRGLGHRVRIVADAAVGECDLLVALHAKKSAEAVRRSRAEHPWRPIVVALTGTDLYRDVARSAAARRSLALADRLIVLHPLGARDLPRALRSKASFVPQASPPIRRSRRARVTRALRVVIVGHLRPVKDPMRIVRALRHVPRDVALHVTHVGRALSASMRRAAERAMANDDRYRWKGERSPAAARAAIAASDLLVLTSRMEGGANVLSEAIEADVAVVASRIASSVGILGRAHPGFFPVGDDRALARLLVRAARDPRWLARLRRAGAARRRMLSPAAERAAWRRLLAEATFRPHAPSNG
jgi:putative glycosyltransferase (TIGR04348 family)